MLRGQLSVLNPAHDFIGQMVMDLRKKLEASLLSRSAILLTGEMPDTIDNTLSNVMFVSTRSTIESEQ